MIFLDNNTPPPKGGLSTFYSEKTNLLSPRLATGPPLKIMEFAASINYEL